MTDVIADRVKVILEAQDDASVKIKAYGETVEQTSKKVEKSASAAQKSVEKAADAETRAKERAAAAAARIAEAAAKAEIREREAAAKAAIKLEQEKSTQALRAAERDLATREKAAASAAAAEEKASAKEQAAREKAEAKGQQAAETAAQRQARLQERQAAQAIRAAEREAIAKERAALQAAKAEEAAAKQLATARDRADKQSASARRKAEAAELAAREKALKDQERLEAKAKAEQETAARKLSNQKRNRALTVQYTVNDIIASAGSGANPMTILAQQGGQVTQAFGGLGNTLKALAPYAFSAGGALTGMGLALGAAIIAADRFDASNKEIINSLTGLGRGAGLTIDQFKAIADANNEAGNVSRDAAEDMARSYINTGKIGGEVVGGLIAITDDYSRATGVDAKKATELLGAAFADPAKGAELLQQQFGFLDAKTLTLIQTMAAAGDTMGAQKLLSDRLAGALAGQADNVSFLTKIWRGLKGAISDAAAAARDFASTPVVAGRAGGAAGAAARAAARQGEAQASAADKARNQRGTEAQRIIDDVTGLGRRRELEGEQAKVRAALKDGTINAKAGAAALKKLKEDIDQIGAGPKAPKAPKATQAETREAVARAEGRVAGPALFGNDSKYGTGLNTDTVSVDDMKELERLFISKGGLEDYIKNGGSDFQAAGGQALQKASDDLQHYQDDVYDRTYDSIASGLEAGFRDGLPGVLQFFSQELQRSLISSLAKSLTDLISQTGPGGSGGTILTAASAIFGRANGGNMVAGRAYQVNEGRPEVFVPPVSGKMVPVSRLGGGQAVTQHVTFRQTIDLKGANGDATIERIARRAAADGAAQALQAANKAAPGRQSSFQKLGT